MPKKSQFCNTKPRRAPVASVVFVSHYKNIRI
nr:MAG TPA_asm: hypothetical protein [Caudoviricetes sp.]